MSLPVGEDTSAGLLLLDTSLVDDGVDVAGNEELESDDDVDDDVDDDGVVDVDVSLLLTGAAVLLLVLCALGSFVGRAEVDGELAVVGVVYGLEAALGELLLGTELVWAMVTPAALTNATTAAMLKVLDTSFMGRTPFP